MFTGEEDELVYVAKVGTQVRIDFGGEFISDGLN